MYSGVHPNKHLQWFIWKYDPVGTPFKWARVFKYLGLFDNVGSRYFLHKYTRAFREENTSWFGVPWMVNLPLKYWPYFNVVEDRSWDEPGYLKHYPTAFDMLRQHNVDFEVVGMKKWGGNEFVQISPHKFTEIRPWTYFFLGSIDPFSHQYTQTQKRISTGHRIKGMALARYHQQMIDLGKQSLTTIAGKKRDISAITLCIDEKTSVKIKSLIHEFQERLLSEAELCEGKDRILQINMQLFPFTKNDKGD